MKQVVVRAYGARLLGSKDAEAHATGVFLGQNKLWNKLVEIEQTARTAYQDALAASDPELASLNEQHAAEEAVMQALLDARASARAAARSKKTDVEKPQAAAIKTSAARLKEIRAQMKICKVRAKEAAKPLVEAAEVKRRELVKAAAEAAGLWWCHSETVLARYDTARVKAMKTGAQLRFHRYDGEGSMGVRFSVAGGDLTKIRAGSTDLLSIERPSTELLGRAKEVKADGGRRVVVTVRAGARAEDGAIPKLRFLVTIPADRDLPVNIPLKTVTLRRDMHVHKSEWKMVFTFSKEVDELPPVLLAQGACGIDFGWRLVRGDDGARALRVAAISWGQDRPVQYVTLDDHWMRRMERADRLRGELDHSANLFASKLLPLITKEALVAAGLSEDEWFFRLALKAGRAKRAYSSLLMAVCEAHAQRDNPVPGLVEICEPWYRGARSLALEAHHTRRKAVDHRKHLFRNVAAQVVSRAGLLGIEDADFRELAATTREDGTDNELVLAARRNRVWASPSELRLAIEQAAKREQREVFKVPAAGTSRACSSCGHVHDSPIVDLVFVCEGCEKVWDQDDNSAHNCREISMQEGVSSLESTA